MSRTIITLFLLFAVSAFAREGKKNISGSLTGELEAGEYLVNSTITVPGGESLSIRAGASLYFDQYAGLEVHGELLVDGTPEAPVALISVNDTANAPEPAQAFDWNGVTAEPGAVLRLRHARISNSVYGVNVKDPDSRAEFVSVVFENNGYASLVRGDNTVPTPPDVPFSVLWGVEEPPPAVPPAVSKNGGSRPRAILNASALGAAALGVVIGGVGIAQMNGNIKSYISSVDAGDPAAAESYKGKIWGNLSTSAVGIMLTGVALVCFGVTFAF